MATLFIVGTPIGNLSDVTLRAIETLKSVPRVYAEDTRRTRALLSHLGITKKTLVALDAHASTRAIEGALQLLLEGESAALVTDAGMPSVSDPGAALVREATARGIAVSVIPGPSAVTTAAALSGLVESSFWFVGFLPRRGGKRRELLERIAHCPDPVLLFEAPNRTAATLEDLAALCPERSAVVCRELTKLHEEARRGTVAELSKEPTWRGEITLVLGVGGDAPVRVSETDIDARIDELLTSGSSAKDAARELARETGLSRRELYERVVARKP
ncbi:MAG: 16S rRNA (cytidine(1402)-2'-O)-methyltransferase [Myxococcales bacterium]|nr:16S rRNA (cytidine(1402)-2'-O)-methyltransferase [Myxococcales bacterium]MCB9580043.1 16S rRNA (cytidine(1402)-2'-O)-methyltransferase [Polyangiaceae bacterium]